MDHAWKTPHCLIFISGILILMLVCPETQGSRKNVVQSQQHHVLDRRRSSFLYDAWGKRADDSSAFATGASMRSTPPHWRIVGRSRGHLLIAIPMEDLNEGIDSVAVEPLDEEVLASTGDEQYKRGAYLDLPWGKKKK